MTTKNTYINEKTEAEKIEILHRLSSKIKFIEGNDFELGYLEGRIDQMMEKYEVVN